MPYIVLVEDWAEKELAKIDKSERQPILKKLAQLQNDDPARHLKKGLPFFVAEAGQYRICFNVDDKKMEKRVYFIGSHKDYEKWHRQK